MYASFEISYVAKVYHSRTLCAIESAATFMNFMFFAFEAFLHTMQDRWAFYNSNFLLDLSLF